MTPIPLPEFADKLSKLMPEIARGTLRREAVELSSGHITLPQFFILNMLGKEDALRMTDIARALGVTTAAATGIVDRLVKSSYAVRVYDTRDRRIIKIRLSPEGRELVQRINKQKKHNIIEIFGKIPSQDRDDFLKILLRVHQIVTRENNLAE
jgi:DNA-binding MarR family transcriptional regulator